MPLDFCFGPSLKGRRSVDRLKRVAANPRTGAPTGVAYGFLVWWGPQVGKPLGEYVSVNAAIQAAAFGAVVGLLYAYSVTRPGSPGASILTADEQSR